MRRSIVRIAGFLILLTLSIGTVNKILSFKFADGNQIFSDFYQLEKDTVDVLVIGSSHAYVNYNNGTLWDEYGIASYDLGSSVQPMWNSYYYLKEALKTQDPELIVLEGYGLSFDIEYSDDSKIIKNTYGMKWSMDKIKAIMASSKKKDWISFLLDYTRYHTRYASLNKGDFYPESTYLDANNYMHYEGLMGQYLFDKANPVTFHDVTNVTGTEELQEKTEKYFRMILELAKEKNIPVAVIVTPYDIKDEAQRKFLRAEEIADEYGAKFFNTNLKLEEIDLDPNTDFFDTAHMTASGSEKYTRYIGKYLKENFVLSDHRGDEKYAAWDRTAEITRAFIRNGEMKNSENLSELAERIAGEDYWVVITLDGEDNNSDPELNRFLEHIGITNADRNYIWFLENGKTAWESGIGNNEYYFRTESHDILISRNEKKNKVNVDGKVIKIVNNGINVIVYDPLMDMVVDSYGIDEDEGYMVVR